jgi:hypothetical protein
MFTCSQKPVTGLHPEPDESIQHPKNSQLLNVCHIGLLHMKYTILKISFDQIKSYKSYININSKSNTFFLQPTFPYSLYKER